MDNYAVPRIVLANQFAKEVSSTAEQPAPEAKSTNEGYANTVENKQQLQICSSCQEEAIYMIPRATLKSNTASGDSDEIIRGGNTSTSTQYSGTTGIVKFSLVLLFILVLYAILVGTTGLVLGATALARR